MDKKELRCLISYLKLNNKYETFVKRVDEFIRGMNLNSSFFQISRKTVIESNTDYYLVYFGLSNVNFPSVIDRKEYDNICTKYHKYKSSFYKKHYI